MTLSRTFFGFGEFARFLDRRIFEMEPIEATGMAVVAKVLHRKIYGMYGDKALPELAQATQDERERLGYAPDEPLLRDGTLLRDSFETEVGLDYAAVGSAEPIVGYHEMGFFNVRANKYVPPRRAVRTGFEEALVPIAQILESILERQLGFSSFMSSEQLEQMALPGMESQAATYMLSVSAEE